MLKKYQQKELNLMCKSDKQTRNYIFSLLRHKSRENWIHKNELVFDFRRQNKAKYSVQQNLTDSIWENSGK